MGTYQHSGDGAEEASEEGEEGGGRTTDGQGMPGGIAVIIFIALFAAAIALVGVGISLSTQTDAPIYVAVSVAGFALFVVAAFCTNGFKIIAPNEAIVLTFFGKYYGTLKDDGFYYVNPLCSAANPAVGLGSVGRKKISLKAMTLNNEKQKVNDEEGNPIGDYLSQPCVSAIHEGDMMRFYKVLGKKNTVQEAIDAFDENRKLLAVIVTASGNPNDEIVNLLTSADLPKLLRLLEE